MNRDYSYRDRINAEGEALVRSIRVALADGSFNRSGGQSALRWLEEEARERNPLAPPRFCRSAAQHAFDIWLAGAEDG